LSYELSTIYQHNLTDATAISRGTPHTTTSDDREISTAVAILCQGGRAPTSGREPGCSCCVCRVRFVRFLPVFLLSHAVHSFPLTLNKRIEYLTLAVGNAKSQPAASGARLESALARLQDLEERLEVAQVQLEILHTLLPRANEGGQVGARIELLQKQLFTVSDVSCGASARVRTVGLMGEAVVRSLCGAVRTACHQAPDPARIGTPG
jgi:hypothetical protein